MALHRCPRGRADRPDRDRRAPPSSARGPCRRHSGGTSTPPRSGYLRSVRMARAHADLLAARRGDGETVSREIANRWGFSQLSRFAHDYKARYGESPRETLSQVRRVTDVAREVPAAGRPSLASSRPRIPCGAHDYICDAYTNTSMRLIGDQTSVRMRDKQHDLGWLPCPTSATRRAWSRSSNPLGRLMVARRRRGRVAVRHHRGGRGGQPGRHLHGGATGPALPDPLGELRSTCSSSRSTRPSCSTSRRRRATWCPGSPP